MNPDDPDEAIASARALALLEATHQFPCAYDVTVIAFNRDAVTADVRRAVILDEVTDAPAGAAPKHETRASREGKYLSHRFAVHMSDGAAVLAMYARLKGIDGVVTVL